MTTKKTTKYDPAATYTARVNKRTPWRERILVPRRDYEMLGSLVEELGDAIESAVLKDAAE